MHARGRADATIVGQVRLELRGGFLEHSSDGRRVAIDSIPRTLGRANCDLRIDDPKVSAAHCELVATERGVRVRDLGSKNGTFIGDVQITEVFLTEPAEITVGTTTLNFVPARSKSHPLPSHFGSLESRSPSMQLVFEHLNRLAPTSANIALTGESGTGKGYLARKIHELSKRARFEFVTIDVSRIAPTLIESTLFGHEKGSFTGATSSQASPLLKAKGGTVFIDEIGELPLPLQSKLLRLVDEKMFQPIGGREQHVDVRFISGTLQNLQEKVNSKEFRTDLFYRLGTPIELPPLRERREDIDLVTRQILVDEGRPELFDTITASTLKWMARRTWEGNLRQLRGVLKLAIEFLDEKQILDVEAAYRTSRGVWRSTTSDSQHLTSHDLLAMLREGGATDADVRTKARRLNLRQLHSDCAGVVSEIARSAKITRNLAREELARMGIHTPEEQRKGGRRIRR